MTTKRVKISCEETERLIKQHDLVVIASCTDMDASFHSEPEIYSLWGTRDEVEVIESRRYPPRGGRGSDPKPCEHWQIHDMERGTRA